MAHGAVTKQLHQLVAASWNDATTVAATAADVVPQVREEYRKVCVFNSMLMPNCSQFEYEIFEANIASQSKFQSSLYRNSMCVNFFYIILSSSLNLFLLN